MILVDPSNKWNLLFRTSESLIQCTASRPPSDFAECWGFISNCLQDGLFGISLEAVFITLIENFFFY